MNLVETLEDSTSDLLPTRALSAYKLPLSYIGNDR